MLVFAGPYTSAAIALTNRTVEGFSFTPLNAFARIIFQPSGELIVEGGFNPPTEHTIAGEWSTSHYGSGTFPGDLYEIFATVLSGDAPDFDLDPFDEWLSLSTERSWALHNAGFGVKEGELEVSIREAGTETVVATAVFTLVAEVSI